jgi:predicted ATP-dependent endonuclease of OLD family
MAAPTIRKLEIKGFRGIRSLVWSPHSRLNVILGAADGGKSTILEAVALLFSTSPSQGLSEFDGALMVVSHDPAFVDAVGIQREFNVERFPR